MQINSDNKLRLVDEIERGTSTNLKIVQTQKSVSVFDLGLSEVEKYKYGDEEYYVDDVYTHIYFSSQLPVLPAINKKGNETFMLTLDQCINNDFVLPFILIKHTDDQSSTIIDWKDIFVVKNFKDLYLIVTDVDQGQDITEFGSYLIGCSCRYDSYDDIMNEPEGTNEDLCIYVDDMGLICEKDFCDYRIRLLSQNIEKKVYEKFSDSDNGFYVELDNTKAFSKSIFLIYDGNLISRPDVYLEDLNDNGFKFKSGFDKTLLTCVIYFYNKANKSCDNLFTLPAEKIKEHVLKDINGTKVFSMDSLKESLSLDKATSYNDRFEAIRNYNSRIVTESVKNILGKGEKERKFTCVTYTGKEVYERLKNGYLRIKKRRWKDYSSNASGFCEVIIFKNYKLFESYGDGYTDKNGDFICYMNPYDMEDDDIFEIMYVAECRPNKAVINVPSKVADVTTCEYYNLDDCFIFDPNPIPSEFPYINPQENMQYAIEFIATKTAEDYTYNIEFEQDKYYGQSLFVVPKARFAYQRIDYYEIEDDVCINLNEKFKYCNDVNRYVIFYNGERLNKEYYDVTIPNEWNPFNELCLYLRFFMTTGDRIEIFYLPYVWEECIMQNVIPVSGNIFLDTADTNYALNNYNYLYFINGRKVPCSMIKNVSLNVVQIQTNVQNIKDLTIVFMGLSSIQQENLINTTADSWNDFVMSLSESEFESFYGAVNIVDDGTKIHDTKITRKALLYQIYKDYYHSYYRQAPYVYTGNQELLEFIDPSYLVDGVYNTEVFDAEKEININFSK